MSTLQAVCRRGLRDQRRTPLFWGGSLGAMSALMAAIWPSIEQPMHEMMRNYPAHLKSAFNIVQITHVEQYIDAEMLSLIVPLAMAFLAVRVIVRMLTGAEERGHLDIVLTTPVSRRALVAGAAGVVAVSVAAVLAVIVAMTWIAGTLAGAHPSLVILARGFANVWPLAMFFAGIAMLATGVLHRGGPVTAIASGSLVAMYVLDLVGKLSSAAEPLRWLSAFKYSGSAIRDGIDPLAFAGLTLASGLLALVGALLFERRDITGT